MFSFQLVERKHPNVRFMHLFYYTIFASGGCSLKQSFFTD